ncbi:MAG: hypothetical protein M3N41_10225 [Acidobacteriota bacterium]|nr:hypothetical protein [Acidobacteriota bacterium]
MLGQITEVLENCPECHGAGITWEGEGPEDCAECNGAKQILTPHNYLLEALKIGQQRGNRREHREVKPEHIEALIDHFRDIVATMYEIPMKEAA